MKSAILDLLSHLDMWESRLRLAKEFKTTESGQLASYVSDSDSQLSLEVGICAFVGVINFCGILPKKKTNRQPHKTIE